LVTCAALPGPESGVVLSSEVALPSETTLEMETVPFWETWHTMFGNFVGEEVREFARRGRGGSISLMIKKEQVEQTLERVRTRGRVFFQLEGNKMGEKGTQDRQNKHRRDSELNRGKGEGTTNLAIYLTSRTSHPPSSPKTTQGSWTSGAAADHHQSRMTCSWPHIRPQKRLRSHLRM